MAEVSIRAVCNIWLALEALIDVSSTVVTAATAAATAWLGGVRLLGTIMYSIQDERHRVKCQGRTRSPRARRPSAGRKIYPPTR